MSFDSIPYDPRPQKKDQALEVYREIATNAGLIRPGDPMDQMLVDAFAALVDRAATIGEGYAAGAGERIRAALRPR